MDTKYCPKCKTVKSTTEFRPNKTRSDGLQGYCRVCDKRSQAASYEKSKVVRRRGLTDKVLNKKKQLQQLVWNYLLSHPCKCGESDPRLLEFDHRDRTTKIREVSVMVGQGLSWSKVLCEIEKCEVMCVKCHRLKTYEQLGWKSWLWK